MKVVRLVGVTGAQGVGKSSFCRKLVNALQESGVNVSLLEGLGDSVRSLGIPVGSDSTSDSIAAIFASHLRREREAACNLNILDRCVVDALAYVRILKKTSPVQERMYEELSKSMARSLDLVIHLQLSTTFESTSANHETTSDRTAIARELPSVIRDLGLASLDIDAADRDALTGAISALKRLNLAS